MKIKLAHLKSSLSIPGNILISKPSKSSPNPFQRRELQPILVRMGTNEQYYEIVAGERRYRACLFIDMFGKSREWPERESTIPCIIRVLNDEEALEIQIIENLHRKDINPMEEAAGFLQLADISIWTRGRSVIA